MAGRQGHLLQIGGIPGAQHDAAIVGTMAQLVDDLGQLVDALAGVVRLGVDVGGAEMAPLEAVDGAEIADGAVGEPDAVEIRPAAVAVPDLDAGGGERQRGGAAGDEPEELGDDGAEKDAFGGEEGEDWCGELGGVGGGGWSGEGEAYGGRGEEGEGAGSRSEVAGGSMRCALGEGGWLVPVWPMFTILEDVADEVEVLILLVPRAFGRQGCGVWFELFGYRHCF